MTFIPSVLSKIDTNNSTDITSDSTFVGSSTLTNGYNSIQITINSTESSVSGGVIIAYSNDDIIWTTYYTDTYLSSNIFNKKYNILGKYYRLSYISIAIPFTSVIPPLEELTDGSDGSINPGDIISSGDIIIQGNIIPLGDIIISENLTNTITQLAVSANLLTVGTITSRLCTDSDDTNVDSINTFDNNIESTIDAFGKLRVTNPQTLLEIKFPTIPGSTVLFNSNSLQVSSGFTGTYSATYADGKCTISGSGTGYFINQSRNFCTYQPGKSLLILASGIINPGNTDYTSRIGYFDNIATSLPNINNGLYFEYSGGIIYVCISNKGTATTRIAQTNWNINKMTSVGINNVILDFTKCQLFVIDLEWLGVGRVRFGFYIYGKIIYVHEVTNINNLTSPYTSSINLPISYSLVGTTGTGSMTQICSTVISEGGYNPVGKPFSVSNTSAIVVTQSETPVILIRGGGINYYHQYILPNSIKVLNNTASALVLYRLRLYKDPDGILGTIVWTNVNTNYSVVQYSFACSNFNTNDSIIVDQGYFAGKGVSTFNDLSTIFSNQSLQISSNINNVSDILVLTCAIITPSSSSDIYATIIWNEVY